MACPVCISPLKFYDAPEKQERFKSYAYGHVSPLLCRANFIPPFQLVATGALNAAVLKSIHGEPDIDVRDNMEGECYAVDGVFQYLGNFSLLPLKVEGEYYLELTLGSTTFYSEVLCFTTSLADCLEIEYWNPECDFYIKNGRVSFDNDFHFKVYLRTQLGKPEYSYEEEATQRYGYTFIESQVSKKVYKFSAVLPEYLCDALRIVRLCSNKVVRSLGDEYEALTFGMEAEWQEQGDLAAVNFEFDVDNIILNLGGPSVEVGTADFNSDYSDDFTNPAQTV